MNPTSLHRFARPSLIALTALALFTSVARAEVDKKSTNAPAKSAAAPVAKDGQPYPFRGTVASTDQKAKTVTLSGKEHPRVLHIASSSLLDKAGKPATLADVAAGDYAHGRVEKRDGNEFIVKGSFGPKPEKKATDAKPADAPAPKVKKTQPQ